MAYANEFNRRRFIFFIDSRGQSLEYELNRINVERKPVEPWTFNSAGINDLTHEAMNYGKSRPFDLLFVVGGICNITVKDWETNTISFPWSSSNNLIQHLIRVIELADNRFK